MWDPFIILTYDQSTDLRTTHGDFLGINKTESQVVVSNMFLSVFRSLGEMDPI